MAKFLVFLGLLILATVSGVYAIAQQIQWSGPGVVFTDLTLPQIIQFSSSAYQNTISTANDYKIPLQPTQSGDALVLGFLYPHGVTISSITNSDSTTWGSAVCTADAGSTNYVTAVYVYPDVGAGVTNFTIAASTNAVEPFQYVVFEVNNVATSSPTNGSLCTANITGPAISPGSFTPTSNNDSNGGNVIWNYNGLCAGTTGGNPTNWVPATNFALLNGDFSNTQGFPHATQWWLQPTRASVTPSITATGDTLDCFNSVSVALKVSKSTGGTFPSSLNIAKIFHEEVNFGGNTKFFMPMVGNLRVIATTWDVGNVPTVTATSNDTCGGSSSFTSKGTTGSVMLYEQNCLPNQNLVVTLNTGSSSGQGSFRVYDVRDANTSSFVNSVDYADSNTCPATTTDAPTITPSTSVGLTIASLGLGTGPGKSLGSGAPSGAVWDLTTYLNETDIDNLENADNQAHVFFSSNTAQNWNYTINASTSCYGIAGVFK